MDSDNKNLEFIKKFNILNDDEDYINCTETSKLLYEVILNMFKIEIQEETNEILIIYQNRVHDCVENMHHLDITDIKSIFEILDKENPYLADIIIMLWCLPRNVLSKNAYNNIYKENISKYNQILADIVDCYVIKNFCIETLSKRNNVPIHCIDILWYYMKDIPIEFIFSDNELKQYICVELGEQENEEDVGFMLVGLHFEYMLEMGLGEIFFDKIKTSISEEIGLKEAGFRCSFKNFAKHFFMDCDLVSAFSQSLSSKNYIRQKNNILEKNYY